MIHPVYDLKHWTQVFPLDLSDRLRKGRRQWDADPVFSPAGIAINEQMRRELWPDLDQCVQFPCDLFTWAWGQPTDPTITRIGGVPYTDESEPWPHDGNGDPMGFVMQINFQDSMDLFGELPGDIMLFFCELGAPDDSNVFLAYSDEPSSYCVKWINSAAVAAPRRCVVPNPLDLWPLHGYIYRSFDVPELDYWVRQHQEPAGRMISADAGFPPAIWWGTKIGGVPHWEYGEGPAMMPQGGRFLCQMISDRATVTHPFIGNRKFFKPRSGGWHWNRRLCIGDVGSAYFFLVGEETYFCSQS
jgi:hypothetical protein